MLIDLQCHSCTVLIQICNMPATIPLTVGIKDLLSMDKKIDEDDYEEQHDKVVKLKFTRKQFQAFRDACSILRVVSEDSRFPEFVTSVLGSDVKVQTISKQMVQPIINAPMKIPVKLVRASNKSEGDSEKKSYFTAPIDATDSCRRLYNVVKDEGFEPRQDINSGITCITDIRVMISKYIIANELRDRTGVVIDDLILDIAPNSVKDNNERLYRIDSKHIIPKGDKKVMTSIIQEIAFGPEDDRYRK